MKKSLIHRFTPATLALAAVAGLPFTLSAQEAAEAEAAPAAEEAAAEPEGPSLTAGMDVPQFDLEGIEWLKGEPVKALNEEGKVYMIECWATWCGPCIAAIPHINELHQKFADKGLVVIGMNVFEDGLEKVQGFVTEQGDGMSYRIAYSGGRESAFGKQWLEAAGINGIPHALFVKDGKLLFTTHPAEVDDELVTEILGEGFDPVAFAAKQKAKQERMEEIQMKVMPMLQGQDWDGVKEFANTELTQEGDKDMKDRLLLMVAMNQSDWATINTTAAGMESNDEREQVFGQAAFMVSGTEGSEEAVKSALNVFSAEMLAEQESVEERAMPGLVRARFLSMGGDNDGALAILKKLSTDAAASEEEGFKAQIAPVIEKAIAAAEAGELGALSELMR